MAPSWEVKTPDNKGGTIEVLVPDLSEIITPNQGCVMHTSSKAVVHDTPVLGGSRCRNWINSSTCGQFWRSDRRTWSGFRGPGVGICLGNTVRRALNASCASSPSVDITAFLNLVIAVSTTCQAGSGGCGVEDSQNLSHIWSAVMTEMRAQALRSTLAGEKMLL